MLVLVEDEEELVLLEVVVSIADAVLLAIERVVLEK